MQSLLGENLVYRNVSLVSHSTILIMFVSFIARVDHSKAFVCTTCGWGFLFWGYLPSRAELKPPYNYLNFKNGPFVCTLSLLILSKSLQFFVFYIPFN